jgi:hypothetical protein
MAPLHSADNTEQNNKQKNGDKIITEFHESCAVCHLAGCHFTKWYSGSQHSAE